VKTKKWSYWGVMIIAATTALTGFLQIVMPKALLRKLETEDTPTSRHFFGTVGMFMVIVGGALLHALWYHSGSRVLVLWVALQKFGASAAVAIGVKRAVFSPLALLIVGFDFLSGILATWYWVHVLLAREGRKARRIWTR
jgi:hypothetical protein